MRDRVEAALEDLRPYIRGHGGDVELVSVKDGVVTVRLTGACVGCPAASATLRDGVEAYLFDRVPEVREVRAVGAAEPAPGPATADLRREHREALDVLRALDEAAAALPASGPIPAAIGAAIDRAADFLATALPLHFRREDDVLFPALDLPRESGPLAQMAYEHDVLAALCGRDFPAARAALAGPAGGAPEKIRAFRRVVSDLGFVLREHIAKEDHVLFPLADRQLPPDVASELAAKMLSIREARWPSA